MTSESIPNPDVIVRRTQYTRTGAPVRLLTLLTTDAEDWVIANIDPAANVRQLACSIVVPKEAVAEVVATMQIDGLVVREFIAADPNVLQEQRSWHA